MSQIEKNGKIYERQMGKRFKQYSHKRVKAINIQILRIMFNFTSFEKGHNNTAANNDFCPFNQQNAFIIF